MTRYRIPAPSIAEPITATPPRKSSHWLRLVGLRTTNTPNTRHRVGVPKMRCLPEAARGLGDGHHVLQLLIDFWLWMFSICSYGQNLHSEARTPSRRV